LNEFNKISKTFNYGDHSITISTGEIARQATAAVMVDVEGTVVLVTVVGLADNKAGQDFLPLTVHYQERAYAAGRVPGGYFKREGKPSEKEVLTSRLIDRPLRPLFPKGFTSEVQIIATVLSLNPDIDSDIPALIGASAALSISGLPFNGPLGAARVAYINEQYVLNPTIANLESSQLDMVVAGTKQAVIMVESEAQELSEELMLGAVMFAHSQMQVVIANITELALAVGKRPWHWQPATTPETIKTKVSKLLAHKVAAAYKVKNKQERERELATMREQGLMELLADAQLKDVAEIELLTQQISQAMAAVEKHQVRELILAGQQRIDGRDAKTVRPITIRTGLLPRVHGSALFTRGETQAIVAATLGTERDAQTIDSLQGERRDSFMLHYNFPPFAVGETGMVGSPKRREIGHGMLAKKAINALLPSTEVFPYVLRVVSEITESNGSSSMATVCGTSLALMDAGVPLLSPVAGIAMGLVKEQERYVVLSDILGDEDYLGDMDFKVAGTAHGITALQMDIKIDGINETIMKDALNQAKEGRLHILAIMNETLANSRQEMSLYAPRIVTLRIPTDKIKDLIGKGGMTIRALTEETGAVIDISDDGEVRIAAVDLNGCEIARQRVLELTEDVELGAIYTGTVVKLMDFGAIVAIAPNRQGLVHISQISTERVEQVRDVLSEGQVIKVKVQAVDRQGKIRLSMKI
jgi:polyribonucleotide nucleotidyltransferase